MLPEGIKQWIIDSSHKELAGKVKDLETKLADALRLLEEAVKVSKELESENQTLKAEVAEFTEREKKRIVNRLKDFIR